MAPVYFAGPSAQLKALYDRMQPYWAQRYLLGMAPKTKRPVQLFVVGGGGDVHGYDPLSGSTKSAMAVAGFNLEKVNNFIGFKDPRDMPKMPTEEEAANLSYAQIAQLKRQVTEQRDFTQRAIDSGSAFARFVVKKKKANELADQLEQVQAELEDLKKVGDKSEHVLPEGADERADTSSAVLRRTISSADLAAARDVEIAIDDTEQKAYWRASSLEFKNTIQAEIDQKYNELISQTPRTVVDDDEAEAKAGLEPNDTETNNEEVICEAGAGDASASVVSTGDASAVETGAGDASAGEVGASATGTGETEKPSVMELVVNSNIPAADVSAEVVSISDKEPSQPKPSTEA